MLLFLYFLTFYVSNLTVYFLFQIFLLITFFYSFFKQFFFSFWEFWKRSLCLFLDRTRWREIFPKRFPCFPRLFASEGARRAVGKAERELKSESAWRQRAGDERGPKARRTETTGDGRAVGWAASVSVSVFGFPPAWTPIYRMRDVPRRAGKFSWRTEFPLWRSERKKANLKVRLLAASHLWAQAERSVGGERERAFLPWPKCGPTCCLATQASSELGNRNGLGLPLDWIPRSWGRYRGTHYPIVRVPKKI